MGEVRYQIFGMHPLDFPGFIRSIGIDFNFAAPLPFLLRLLPQQVVTVGPIFVFEL